MDGFLANGQRVYDQNDKRMFHWEAKDEYGVYRDEEGNTHAMESRCQKKTYKKYLRWQIAWEVDILAYHNMKDTFRCPKSILTLLIQRNL